MCLAVPGKVLEITERDMTRMAMVDFGGVVKEVCLAYLPDLQVGDYTIVHVGFAIQKLDEASALETLALFSGLGMLDEEFADAGAAGPLPSQGPAPSQPAPSQPAPSQPAPSQPAPSQPAPSQPAPSQPEPEALR